MAWAFSFAGMLATSVLEWIHEVVTHVGHTFDALQAQEVEQTYAVLAESGQTSCGEKQPYIVATFSDRLVIYKPPGWQVDCEHMPYLDEQNNGAKLSCYVQSLGQWATEFDPYHDFGFLHRIDVPSSGLVLVAKTYKAHYDLKL